MPDRNGEPPARSDGPPPIRTDGGSESAADQPTGADSGGSQTGSDGAPDAGGGRDLPVTRRQALAGIGVLAVVGVGAVGANLLRPARAIPPEVPEDALSENDWVLVDEVQEPVVQDSAGPVSIEAIAATVRYENQGLLADIRDQDIEIQFRGETRTERLGDHIGEQFDQSMGVYAATKIDISPHIDELPAGIGRGQVMGQVESQAQSQFEQQLEEAGLEDIRQVDSTVSFEPNTGADAVFYEYRGAFTFEPTTLTIDGVPVSLSGGSIDIAGYLAIWHTGQNVIIAAGAHPNENYTDTVTESAAGDELTVAVDLGLRPSELREEVLDYMARVE